jgi:nicotinate-nucleotide adenylyltransferase
MEHSRTGPRAAQRIGLFGGSFDPVHSGHLHAARAALDAFDLDRVVFVPAARAPHKPGLPHTSDEHRLAMLRLAIAAEPRFSVSDLELRRGGTSYTIDTVRALPAELGLAEGDEIFLVLGSDNLRGLSSWRDVRELLELARPIVVQREGDPDRLLDDLRRNLGEAACAKLDAGYLRRPPVPVSSTELREHMRGSRTPLEHEIPAAVQAYIQRHRLYGARS